MIALAKEVQDAKRKTVEDLEEANSICKIFIEQCEFYKKKCRVWMENCEALHCENEDIYHKLLGAKVVMARFVIVEEHLRDIMLRGPRENRAWVHNYVVDINRSILELFEELGI